MKQQTCCFTGHRDIFIRDRLSIKRKTKAAIISLIEQGVTYFGAGGARGFDTLAANLILELKQQYPHIKLILVLPCEDQTKGWSDADKQTYDSIRSRADKVKVLSRTYYPGCMHARNRHMIDHSAHCICYCRKENGGTAYTVAYAHKQHVHVIAV